MKLFRFRKNKDESILSSIPSSNTDLTYESLIEARNGILKRHKKFCQRDDRINSVVLSQILKEMKRRGYNVDWMLPMLPKYLQF